MTRRTRILAFRTLLAVLGCAWLILGGQSRADMILADGQNHVLTVPINDRYIVVANSTLTVGPGGQVLAPAPQGAQSVFLSQGNLVLAGGSISGSFYGVNGAVAASFQSTGGTVQGGVNGGTAVWMASGGVNVSGGNFLGGSGGGNGMLLDSGSVPGFLNTTISGGVFSGGANSIGLGGTGLFLSAFGVNNLAISGGTFNAGAGANSALDGSALRIFTSADPTKSFSQQVNVTGGIFNGSIDLRGMYVNATVNFFGPTLAYTDLGNGNGRLQGLLTNGDLINALVFNAGDVVDTLTAGQVTFRGTPFTTAVPEPSPMTLAALAASCGLAWNRRRAKGPARRLQS